jgi:hypothetical protein
MKALDNPSSSCEHISVSGRTFSSEEVGFIKQIISNYPNLSRTELAATVCELLEWERPNGQLKTRECRDLLEALDARKVAELPKKRQGRPVGSKTRAVLEVSEPVEQLTCPLAELQPIRLVRTETPKQRQQWRGYVERYHYLGHKVPFGAHLRYLVLGGRSAEVIGAVQYSSPAWRMKDRDNWIGWDDPTREKQLQKLVNQSRFLILPWVQVKNLASHVLALSARQIADDWAHHYHVRPLLLESLVDGERYEGTCYRAANWIPVGLTAGRGRMDKSHKKHGLNPKQIFVYPLVKRARQKLLRPET